MAGSICMSFRVVPALATVACLALLAGCGSALNGNMLAGKSEITETADAAADNTASTQTNKPVTPASAMASEASNVAPAAAPIAGATAAAAKANAEVTGTTAYPGPAPRRLLA